MTAKRDLALDAYELLRGESSYEVAHADPARSPEHVRREIEIEAPPEQVWDALADEEGRERWLDQPDRAIVIEVAEEPRRLVWWWGGEGERPTRVEFELIPAVAGTRVLVTESAPEFPIAMLAERFARVLVSDQLDSVFAALADPTRRWMVQALLRDGTTSVPGLSAELPITRQAVAKHLTTLDDAGLVERAPGAGREVRYRLRPGALRPASAWLAEADAAWQGRLARLKGTVEGTG